MPLATWVLLVFIGLKLGAVIGWSWWWVLSPIWAFVLWSIIGACLLLIEEAIEDKS